MEGIAKMLKWVFIMIAIVAVGCTLVYAYFNRGESRVLLSITSLFFTGSLVFIANEIIHNDQISFSKKFSTVFFYGIPTKYRPLNVNFPYTSTIAFCLQEHKFTEKELSNLNFEAADNPYFEAFQAAIISELMQKFDKDWLIKHEEIITPNGKSFSWGALKDEHENGKKLTADEVAKLFPNNEFLHNQTSLQALLGISRSLVIPSSTEIEVDIDEDAKKAVIILSTRYIDVTISLSFAQMFAGLGEYSRLLGIDKSLAQDQYQNLTYVVSIDAQQNRWLNGAPEMKQHRAWADSIASLLEDEFSYEKHRKNHVEEFMLRRSASQTIRIN